MKAYESYQKKDSESLGSVGLESESVLQPMKLSSLWTGEHGRSWMSLKFQINRTQTNHQCGIAMHYPTLWPEEQRVSDLNRLQEKVS